MVFGEGLVGFGWLFVVVVWFIGGFVSLVVRGMDLVSVGKVLEVCRG